MPDPRIVHVIVWSNGMVSVFDRDGAQLPEYQGRFAERRAAIVREAPPSTSFDAGAWGPATSWPLTRAEFEAFPLDLPPGKGYPRGREKGGR